MELTGNHLKAARALVGIDQERLAELSGVSINTVRNMEACGEKPVGGYARTREQMQSALEGLGIEFTNGNSPGVKLTRRGSAASAAPKGPVRPRSPGRSKTRHKPSRRHPKAGG